MNKNKYKNPKITINKVYTRHGDNGNTHLVGGKKIPKSDIRIEAYGDLDELNSLIGLCIAEIELNSNLVNSNQVKQLLVTLYDLQHQVFNTGNMIASLKNDIYDSSPQINENDIKNLEKTIDKYNELLPPLSSFVLPGGSKTGALFHILRTVVRRCERKVARLHEVDDNLYIQLSLKFLNRLSDAFFVFARWVVLLEDKNEVLWNPNYKGKQKL